MGIVPHLPALHKDQGLDLHQTEADKPRGTEVVKGDQAGTQLGSSPKPVVVTPNTSEASFIS